jgi:hypothetical protein
MKMANARPRVADHELTPEEGLRGLNELFGSKDASAPPSRGCRKYFLEYQDGEPVFRLAEMPIKPALPRDEIGVALDEVMLELFGPDPDGNVIVPQKLANYFRDREQRPEPPIRRRITTGRDSDHRTGYH